LWKIDKGSYTGTTASSYASALDWDTAELGAKTILLKNTHVSASLKYRLHGYAVDGGIEKELVAETVLQPGETAEFHYDRQWEKLILQVLNGSGTAAYEVDYEGQGA
jgi:hypothetical protein